MARQLGKKVRLEIDGRTTDVHRDVAALLDAPLIHLVRNAVDHGTHALGLGELSVLSSLDQPLHATVELLGAPPAMEASCLSLRGSDNGLPAPAHPEFRIEHKGDNALLHITTPRADQRSHRAVCTVI